MRLSKHLGVVSHCYPRPVHPPDKFQTVRKRVLKVLISPSGEIVRKEAGGGNLSTRRWGDELVFPNSPRSDGVPCSVCPMHVLAVWRVAWIWRFGTHGIRTRQYYSKGVAFADFCSPRLSAPRVSSLSSHPAVCIDMVNQGCLANPERIV